MLSFIFIKWKNTSKIFIFELFFWRDFFESIILLLRLLEFKLKLESELNIIVVFELVFFISINVSFFLISLINELMLSNEK